MKRLVSISLSISILIFLFGCSDEKPLDSNEVSNSIQQPEVSATESVSPSNPINPLYNVGDTITVTSGDESFDFTLVNVLFGDEQATPVIKDKFSKYYKAHSKTWDDGEGCPTF